MASMSYWIIQKRADYAKVLANYLGKDIELAP